MPKPVGRDIAVRVKKLEEKTEGGIYIPDEARKGEDTALCVGEVVELGPYSYLYDSGPKPWCKPGDMVYFVSYVGFRVPSLSSDTHYIRMVPEDAIKGLVEKDDAVNNIEFLLGVRN